MKNFLITITDEGRTEERFITVYAISESAALTMGEVAADLMEEEFHKGRTFYADRVMALE